MKLAIISSLLATIGLVSGQTFRAAEMKTQETYLYGRFETRMKAQNALGTVQSFFLYWDGPNWTQNQWNEIDMEIVPSAYQNAFSRNIIYGDGKTKKDYQGPLTYKTGGFADWHIYTVEWTPDRVSWFLDNQHYLTVDSSHEAVRYLTKHMHFMINVWSPDYGTWSQGFNPTKDFPVVAQYDYVKVWGYNTATKQFEFKWQDDFNNFDYGRWIKSDGWGFQGNRATFSKDNVFTLNGMLHMRLDYWPHAATEVEVEEHHHHHHHHQNTDNE